MRASLRRRALGVLASLALLASAAPATMPVAHAADAPSHDNSVWWDGIRHDSRDTLYRTPSGAVTAGTPVTLRLRTFHDDVTSVSLRLYSLNAAGAETIPMTRAAAGVSCYDQALADKTCDLWEYTVPGTHAPDNLWYRFVVSDGTDTVYYGDDTPALDGGVGKTTREQVDQSWALMLAVPGFTAPEWAKDQVVYQIFPDRFRNGRKNNDPKTGDVRYDDPVIKLPWGTRPEGYCRNYEGATTATCPWRWQPIPAWGVGQKETPRGRDYMGGDLKGIDQQLDYLQSVGITAIYLNPIFDAGSNHGYDTQDYKKVDPYFGTSKDFDNLVKHAHQRGMRIILDGVFNHMSSDSPFFDRYHHYPTVGACESVSSPWRSWFTFKPQAGGPCAGPDGPNTMAYEGWFGFDSIPVLTKTNAEVQAYFLTAPDSVAKLWLQRGADGWRLDVSGDQSFPDGYWEKFRTATKSVKPDSLSISETWQKDSTLLRMLRGDRLDTTMNYRLRDAVLGLLAPQSFDPKGFADSGRRLKPSEFANRLASVREDYTDASYYSLLNLLDSHDTERLAWTLTDGPYNQARDVLGEDDKARIRMAALIQFTQAGMPSVYYGDEVGLTGADDPDDRRTYPWADLGGTPDLALKAYYGGLANARTSTPALTDGDFKVLLADDQAGTVAYGRKTATNGAVVVLNPTNEPKTVTVPVAGYLPDGLTLSEVTGTNVTGATAGVHQGAFRVELPAMGGVVLTTGRADLAGPAATTATVAAEKDGAVELSWTPVADAVGYNVYVSPVSGGGYVLANAELVTGTSYTLTGLTNSTRYHVVVRAVDAAGNEGAASNEVVAIPHATIGWANLQWPTTIQHTLSAAHRTPDIYGQVWIDGVTSAQGQTPGLIAQVGYGPHGTAPAGDAWQWEAARFNGDAGNNDEFVGSLLPQRAGDFDYLYRYSLTGGRDWVYGQVGGILADPTKPADNPGRMTVAASNDTSAPAVPSGLAVTSASPSAVQLSWTPVTGDTTLYGYEVGRRVAGTTGDFVVVGQTTQATYTDATVAENGRYEYAVRSLDDSFNRSAWSAPVTAEAKLRNVKVVVTVTVPATTDAQGKAVHMAGSLDKLGTGLPSWDPAGAPLTRIDATHWQLTLSGIEGTQVEYKYTLGSWDNVEKDNTCGEVANRQLTLTYGTTGTQQVSDTVTNWRNVAPCGN